MNKLLLWICVLVLSIAVVSAQQVNTSRIEFSTIKITSTDVLLGGDSSKVGSETKESFKVPPGAKLSFEITVKNLIPDAEDLAVEDVAVEATIYGIDDGDDLQEDDTIDQIKTLDKEKVTLDFDIPKIVDEGSYDVTIIAEGSDENGTTQQTSKNFTLRVDKENHMVLLEQFELSSAKISCLEQAELRYSLLNIGSSNEDDTIIKIKNDQMKLNYNAQKDIESGGPNDDVEIKETVLISAENVKPGTYTISFSAAYDDGDTVITKTVPITVEKCVVEEAPVETVPTNNVPVETNPVQQPAVQPTIPTQPQQVVVQYQELPPASGVFASAPTPSFFEANKTLVLIAAAVLALLLVAWIVKK